jgi:hypothetical protein
MRFMAIIAIVPAVIFGTAANAQVISTNPGTTYLAVVSGTIANGGYCVGNLSDHCVNPALGIPLDNYATSSALATTNAQVASQAGQIATANGQIATLNAQSASQASQIASQGTQVSNLTGQVSALNNQVVNLGQQLRDTNSYVAAVGAMHDAIPDPGDIYAVRVNSAAVNGVVAFGASASANLGSGFRASVNYAGARGQSAVSGGLNFSFH